MIIINTVKTTIHLQFLLKTFLSRLRIHCCLYIQPRKTANPLARQCRRSSETDLDKLQREKKQTLARVLGENQCRRGFSVLMFFSLNISEAWIGLEFNGRTGCSDCNTMVTRNDMQQKACDECRARWFWQGHEQHGNKTLDRWYRNEPTGGPTCGKLSTINDGNGAWHDYGCQRKLPYICKYGGLYNVRGWKDKSCKSHIRALRTLILSSLLLCAASQKLIKLTFKRILAATLKKIAAVGTGCREN